MSLGSLFHKVGSATYCRYLRILGEAQCGYLERLVWDRGLGDKARWIIIIMTTTILIVQYLYSAFIIYVTSKALWKRWVLSWHFNSPNEEEPRKVGGRLFQSFHLKYAVQSTMSTFLRTNWVFVCQIGTSWPYTGRTLVFILYRVIIINITYFT